MDLAFADQWSRTKRRGLPDEGGSAGEALDVARGGKMGNDFDGIPKDFVNKMKSDYMGAEHALKFYKAIMDTEYPEIDRNARWIFIRNAIKERSWCSFEDIHQAFKRHISELERMKRLEKKRQVIVDIERIIGNSCYNGNIQNYSSWGVWESEGRSFRYPVSYHDDDGKHKCYSISENMPIKAMMTGYYAFGANQLFIFEAIEEILSYLENNYGLDVTRGKKRK